MKPITLVFDPGHGDHDSGAVTPTGIKEKDLALTYAKHLQLNLLAAAPIGSLNVLLTRETDRFLTLSARAKIANDAKAHYFASIHLNSAQRPEAQGTETFIYSSTTTGLPWGSALQDSLAASYHEIPNRGLKTANFAVLRLTRMPAALIELFFLHNPSGDRLARDLPRLEAAAIHMADAILQHLGLPNTIQAAVPPKLPAAVSLAKPEPQEPPTHGPCDPGDIIRAYAQEIRQASAEIIDHLDK